MLFLHNILEGLLFSTCPTAWSLFGANLISVSPRQSMLNANRVLVGPSEPSAIRASSDVSSPHSVLTLPSQVCRDRPTYTRTDYVQLMPCL